MTVIATNISALRAGNASNSANMMLSSAMQRLSTGNRINSAKDDAAGLAISTSMSSQIRGMTQAIRNANDGVSLAQTADGALEEATNMLQRIRELAVQSASGTSQDSDRADMQTEVTQLQTQLIATMGTQFNGNTLFSNTADKQINIQTGANATDSVKLNITKLDLTAATGTVASATGNAALGAALAANDALVGTKHVITASDVAYGATFKDSQLTASTNATPPVEATSGTTDIGKTVTLQAGDRIYQASTTTGNASGGVDISLAGGATNALTVIDQALTAVATTRASLGAGESRLSSVVNNLTSNVTNLTSAKSQITDTDFSAETANLAKAQILSQASTAMLAQANQSQQGVLKLLQ